MRASGRREEGQAAVELALLLPLLATLAMAIVQVGLVVRDQVLVVHAAREVARQAAVSPSHADARAAGLRATPLKRTRLSTDIAGGGRQGRPVTAIVRYRAPTDVPLVGPLLPDVSLEGKATMRYESDKVQFP